MSQLPLIVQLSQEADEKTVAMRKERKAAMRLALEEVRRAFRPKEQEIADLRTAIRVLKAREQEQPLAIPSHLNPYRTSTLAAAIPAHSRGGAEHVPAYSPLLLVEQQDRAEPSPTFTQVVTEVAEEIDRQGREITNGNVFVVLMSRGIDLPNNPRIKIGTILRRLAERGIISEVESAAGNRSTVYKWIRKEDAPA